MAYTNQTVEEILVLARHGASKKNQKNRGAVEALGQDILGSLDDDELYEAFLGLRSPSATEEEKESER